jgi:hypothetical protein
MGWAADLACCTKAAGSLTDAKPVAGRLDVALDAFIVDFLYGAFCAIKGPLANKELKTTGCTILTL